MKPDPAPLATEVWWAHTSAADDRLLRLLDEEELTRNSRFRHQADRDRHLLGRATARLLLAERAGCPPEKVTFALRCRSCEEKERTGADEGAGTGQGPHGKPRPTGPAEGWEVSVSHSGEWVALAMASGVPVGVDVERVSAARDLEGLVTPWAILSAMPGSASPPPTGSAPSSATGHARRPCSRRPVWGCRAVCAVSW
jgi:4'-phosphopantetheinyl transferase